MQAHPDDQDEDENYHSASDEDFDPEATANGADDAASSDDEEDGVTSGSKKRKVAGEAEDLGFDNSGDEATVRKGQRSSKKKKKKKRKGGGEDDEDQGGDGGLIKTRSQRLQETKEKKPLVQVGKATVDIDDLWARMSAPTTQAPGHESPSTSQPAASERPVPSPDDTRQAEQQSETKDTSGPVKPSGGAAADQDSGMVTIKRTYEFAGKVEQEERLVPANSAEAKLYFAEQKKKEEQERNPPANGAAKPGLRKVMKRKSMFSGTEVPQGNVYGSAAVQGAKLNTLQKSRLDWAQQVDKDGTGEELDEHSRAKDSYSSRMDFLGRMEAKREQDSRRPQ